MKMFSKTAYAAGDVILSSGSWRFDNALLGTFTSDQKMARNLQGFNLSALST